MPERSVTLGEKVLNVGGKILFWVIPGREKAGTVHLIDDAKEESEIFGEPIKRVVISLSEEGEYVAYCEASWVEGGHVFVGQEVRTKPRGWIPK
ncbi:hypothetical protein HY008_02460 [Candidatus Woesebacteria bacterium]|nr:hypothetical protein [Candidatus Woesebacteria bacterium]